jgi:hypothetical protein
MLNSAELCRTLSKSMAQPTQPELPTSAARNRLAALGEKKPRTKAAQLRMLWPEIKAALDRSHTLKAVCECLEADGIQMSIYTRGSYVTRMRRSSAVPPQPPEWTPRRDAVVATNSGESASNSASFEEQKCPSPLANLRKSQAKKRNRLLSPYGWDFLAARRVLPQFACAKPPRAKRVRAENARRVA